MGTVKLGIIGTGSMANAQAINFAKIKGCKIAAACDLDQVRLNEYCVKYNIPKQYAGVKEMLKDTEINAISVVTPDSSHAPLSIMALEAGKHLLCEKPLATNYPDAKKMVRAAKKSGLINMVNFSYRNNSAIHRAARMIEQGKIGKIRHIHAHYLQSWLASDYWGNWKTSPQWLWRLSTEHGSTGVLGDIGVHIIDFVTYPAGPIKSVHCKLQNYPDKAPSGRIDDYKLDANDTAIITAEFQNGAVGTIHTSRTAAPHKNSLKLNLYGDKGSIEVDLDRSSTSLDYWPIKKGKLAEKQVIETKKDPGNFYRFIKSIRTGKQEQPDFARGAEIQQILDACILSDAEEKTIKL